MVLILNKMRTLAFTSDRSLSNFALIYSNLYVCRKLQEKLLSTSKQERINVLSTPPVTDSKILYLMSLEMMSLREKFLMLLCIKIY